MINQYFTVKIDEFLPKIIKHNISLGKISQSTLYNIFFIDQKYLRKLKIQNIEGSISEDDKDLLEFLINKDLLEFLINKDLTKFITKDEYELKLKNASYVGVSGSCGTSGTVGISGFSGISGVSGVSGTQGTGVSGTSQSSGYCQTVNTSILPVTEINLDLKINLFQRVINKLKSF
jgi:hypothetical protein